ncbi:MAG: T9SS type A sorting domain-containing protein, partial [Prolixibacteraceae bacterium]|nr:T9SS type A sorting domain-containing protein [Prolixibacteraceae bacterium]
GMKYSINGTDYSNTNGIFTGVVPGSYTVTAKNLAGCVSPGTSVIINPPTSHFAPVLSGNGFAYMNFYASTAKINGTDLQPGDEIGIFDGTVCVGSGVLTELLNGENFLEIRIKIDDPLTTEIDGFTEGDFATFKLWDASENREISEIKITYIDGDNIFTNGASTWYHIGGFVPMDQEIMLTNGWNIFSLFVTPENANMMQVVQSLINAGSLVKVMDEAGHALELIPGTSTWANQIGNWRNTEGYQIRINTPTTTTLTVSGLPIYQAVPIDLISGWNIISYPVSSSQNALTFINSLVNSGTLVKVQDEIGAAIERNPITSQWINNIDNFNPGEGYKVRVNANDLFTVNPNWTEIPGFSKSAISTAVPEYFKTIWKGNGFDHMNFYLSEINSGTTVLKAGNEIGIYDGQICVGAGVIQNTGDQFYSFVVSADDPTTIEIDGFIKGHTPSFRVWDPVTNKETPIKEIEYYQGSNRVFEPMGTASIGINSITGLDIELGAMTSLGNNYPNPFHNETTIPYVIGKETMVDISIYDMIGRKINTLVHGIIQPGSYTAVWKANDSKANRIKPGTYICKMQVEKGEMVKLMVVQ